MPVVNPLGWPHRESCCLALATSPCGLVVASYRSKCFCPMTFGGATVPCPHRRSWIRRCRTWRRAWRSSGPPRCGCWPRRSPRAGAAPAAVAARPVRWRTGRDGARDPRAAGLPPRVRGALLAAHCRDVPRGRGGADRRPGHRWPVRGPRHAARDPGVAGNSLERSWRSGDWSLDGHGVQLLPSALWAGPPLFADHPPRAGGNALIYAARRTVTADEAGQPGNLAGLLGHTRAAVLRALRTPRSTTELAACVGTSAPSASEHATALRASGLVQTVRRGRRVNHSLTPLGRSLLNGNLNAH